MKTKKHLSDFGINHTGGGGTTPEKPWNQLLTISLPPNSLNAKQRIEKRFKPSILTTLGKEDKYATNKFKNKPNLFMVIEIKIVVTSGGGN